MVGCLAPLSTEAGWDTFRAACLSCTVDLCRIRELGDTCHLQCRACATVWRCVLRRPAFWRSLLHDALSAVNAAHMGASGGSTATAVVDSGCCINSRRSQWQQMWQERVFFGGFGPHTDAIGLQDILLATGLLAVFSQGL